MVHDSRSYSPVPNQVWQRIFCSVLAADVRPVAYAVQPDANPSRAALPIYKVHVISSILIKDKPKHKNFAPVHFLSFLVQNFQVTFLGRDTMPFHEAKSRLPIADPKRNLPGVTWYAF